MSFRLIVLVIIVLSSQIPQSLSFSGDLHAHDPSFIKSGNSYYIFSTQEGNNAIIPIRKLYNDNSVRNGTLFKTVPTWIRNFTKVAPGIWAPDVNYFNNKYYVYYCGSSWYSRNSVIALATASNVFGPYTDKGEVIHTTDALQYNAIDPEIAWTVVNGQRVKMWLVFGSYWEGIKARCLNMTTGLLSTEDTTLYSLASRNGKNIEASSVAYRNVSSVAYYYLFVSFDLCCKGANSTYRIMMGRSNSITGPYVDKLGVDMMNGGGTEILASNFSSNVRGPGGCDVILDNGIYRMIYHWYNANANGRVENGIVDLNWSPDNWPSVGPQSKLNYN